MVSMVTQTDLVIQSYQLSEMIVSSELYEQFIEAKNKLKADIYAQQLIWEFNHKKNEYEEVQRFGKYHPDYDKVSKEVRELKRKLDLYDPIAQFKKIERQLEELMNEISVLIAKAVSDSIKVPTGNPYFDSLSCGGCSSGGGCSCS